jgi:NTP pyrophosphatase (non-canonical NTP hydrolase)
MTIDELYRINLERCNRWHPGGIHEWTPLEWAGAMCGEAGEAANAAKKLRRVTSHLQNINQPGRSLIVEETAKAAICREVADTILYAMLLLGSIDCQSPDDVIKEVFNQKSIEYGFPERL